MTPTDMNPQELAGELYRAVKTAEPVELLTKRLVGLNWDDARQVARATDALRREAGETQVGWKLGWTSAAMREALGVDRPNWGTLWDTQLLQPGAELELDNFIHPKVEPELVWRCPTDIEGDAVTAEDIAELDGDWALGLEVVDPRFPSFSFDALDNTADNSSSAAAVTGPFGTGISPAHLSVTFSDGRDHRNGVGANAMESPLEAVAWFVRALAGEQLALKEGQIVYTGGLTAPFDVTPGLTYQLSGPPLGDVAFTAIGRRAS